MIEYLNDLRERNTIEQNRLRTNLDYDIKLNK